MRKLKYFIAVVILFITIGFATINYTLSIDGDTELTGDLSDFKVYFSKLKINGVDSPESIISDTELYVSGVIDTVGDTYTVNYDITNSSKLFDANITMNCTGASDYLSVTNNFDTTNTLSALSTRSGTLVFTKIKTIASTDSFNFNVSCKFVASPVERETIGSGSVVEPLNPYYIGREVAIGSEKFNIISDNGSTITMLTQRSIGLDFKQSSVVVYPVFSGESGWEYSPGPKEIDVQTWGGRSKEFLNNYVAYLKELTGDQTVQGDFITLKQLESLGCIIADDYTYSTDEYCGGSIYGDWLIIDKYWWTKSASSEESHKIWAVGESGYMQPLAYGCGESSVRPVVTISKEVAEQLLRVYPIGKEISIGTEKFNVISDNGTTVSMLAQYGIDYTNLKQSPGYGTSFANGNGWAFESEPVDVDIQIWGGNSKEWLNNYVVYLQNTTGSLKIFGGLISLESLLSLGCKESEDVSTGRWTCVESPYASWLINGMSSWTRTAFDSNSILVFDNIVDSNYHKSSAAVRPVITISKDLAKILEIVYPVGTEITISTEKFNVISDNGATVSMLAQYNLNNSYRQSTINNNVHFSDVEGWEYTPGPKEINIQTWSTNPKVFVNAYVDYLKSELNNNSISGDLITLEELGGLGCSVPVSYGYVADTSQKTCVGSVYESWLVNGQYLWTRSAYSGSSIQVWMMDKDGILDGYSYYYSRGIRPVITISKEELRYIAN